MTDNVKKALILGALAGPIFWSLVIGQALTREGFDLSHHPLSLLAVGERGWIQTMNFILVGLAAAAGAYGLSRSEGSTALLWALGAYALGMLMAAAFPSPPAMNFPLGSVESPIMSTRAKLHGAGFGIAHIGIICATLILAFRYRRRGRKALSLISFAAALVTPIVIVSGFASETWRGACFFGAGVITLGWLMLMCLDHLSHAAEDRPRNA